MDRKIGMKFSNKFVQVKLQDEIGPHLNFFFLLNPISIFVGYNLQLSNIFFAFFFLSPNLTSPPPSQFFINTCSSSEIWTGSKGVFILQWCPFIIGSLKRCCLLSDKLVLFLSSINIVLHLLQHSTSLILSDISSLLATIFLSLFLKVCG
jgi:hypothetical protein